MSHLARWLFCSAVAVTCYGMVAFGQQVPSFSGRVQKAGGTGLAHAIVRIEGAGSAETSDSGEFTFDLSGHLKIGYAATFHVTNWVILKPCELKNGRTYLHDPAAEPIEIVVLAPGDSRLKSATSSESLIGCLIEEEASRFAPKSRSHTGPRSLLPKGEYIPYAIQPSLKNVELGIELNSCLSFPHLLEAAYHPQGEQNPTQSHLQEVTDALDPARDEFLAGASKELGFSIDELKSAIVAWTKSVDDPYQKGLAALYDGEYAHASEYILKSLNTPKGDVITHYVPLARAEYGQGHYLLAESALRRVLTVYSDDPTTINNLGVVLAEQAKFSEAERLHKRALDLDEGALGPDNPGVATDLNNLAMLYDDLGKYREAEPLRKRALEIDERAFGSDDPNVARDLNYLAVLYIEQGKYREAEPRCKRALAIDERAFGPDHPNVARDLDTLISLYFHQRKYSQAEPLCKRALAIDEKELGGDHLSVATLLNNLAALYAAMGKYSEAEPLYTRALAITENVLGLDHPEVAICLNNLAVLYKQQRKFSEAEPLYKRALAIDEKALGSDHPTIAIIATNLATTLRELGRGTESKSYEEQAAKVRKKNKQLRD